MTEQNFIRGIEPFVYLETKRVKVSNIAVTTGVGVFASAQISLPPSEYGSRIFPGTRVEIYLKTDEEQGPFLYFQGEVRNRPSMGVGIGNKIITLSCVSDFVSLRDSRLTTLGVQETTNAVVKGTAKMITGSGSIKIPTVNAKAFGASALWNNLIPSKEKGKVIGKMKKESESQADDVVSYKGKLHGVLQSLMLSSPIFYDKLRRTQFLDRMGMYLDEHAVRMLWNDLPTGSLSSHILDRVWNGNKDGWTAFNQHLRVIFHDCASVCPPLKGVFDIPDRDIQYLPKNWTKELNSKGVSEGITAKNYMDMQRDQLSILEMIVKPKMEGTFPPKCNVLNPSDYSAFQFTPNTRITRMAMQMSVQPHVTETVYKPSELEDAYRVAIKYGGKNGWTAKSDLVNHQASDFTTNEERLYGKIGFLPTGADPLLLRTIIGYTADDYDKEKEKLFNNVREETDDILVTMPDYGSNDLNEEVIRKILVARGYTESEAKKETKQYLDQIEARTAISDMETERLGFIGKMKTKLTNKLADVVWDQHVKNVLDSSKKTDRLKQYEAFLKSKSKEQDRVRAVQQEAQRVFDDARSGDLSVSGRFNLAPVCGFPILFSDNEGSKDIVAYLVGKTDILNFENGSCTTQYTVSQPELMFELDYNKVTRDMKFAKKTYGQNKFAWGKGFDYSELIYKRYLGSHMFVPAMYSKLTEDQLPPSIEYSYIDQTDSALFNSEDSLNHYKKGYVSLPESLALLGLRQANKSDFSEFEPELRSAKYSAAQRKLADKPEYSPGYHLIDMVYGGNRNREQFYCVADVVPLLAEKARRDGIFKSEKELYQALDIKGGRLTYIADAINPKKSISATNDTSNMYPSVQEFYDDLIAGSDPLVLYPLDFYAITEEGKSDSYPVAPRWEGNPGVTHTDLLLSYLSCYEPPLTHNEIHGPGNIPSEKDIEKVKPSKKEQKASERSHSGKYRKPAKNLVKTIAEDIIADIKKNMQKWVEQDKGTAALDKKLATRIDTLAVAKEQKKKVDEMAKYGKRYNRKKTDVQLTTADKLYIKKRIKYAIQKMDRYKLMLEYYSSASTLDETIVNTGSGDKKKSRKKTSTAPISRPLSESDAILIRSMVIDNMVEELKDYARASGDN